MEDYAPDSIFRIRTQVCGYLFERLGLGHALCNWHVVRHKMHSDESMFIVWRT